ncbi:MAG: O-antigen ligase family protein [Verrucomicrobiota bacterium]
MGIWRVSRTDFFATFEYPNHAAAWFYLHAALAAGMAYDAEIKRKPRIRVAVFGACFMCCIAASCLTLSRVGAFAALVQLAVVSVMLLFWIRKNLRSEAALNAYIGVAIVALIGVTLFLGAGRGSLAWEVGSKTLLGRQSIAADFSTRAGHVDCAWEMIKDYPVFGVGAQGCHALAHQYIPEEELRSWMVNGRANVHCDPIQFLAEFGVVGSLAMALVVAALVQNMVSARHSALFYWAAGGLALVFVHSLIDLPFRCPAILLIWSCLSAALPCLVSSEHGTGDGMKKAGILQDVAF